MRAKWPSRLAFIYLLESELYCFYLWQDAFILETGQGIYVWEGKKSTRNEKNQAFKDAQVSESFSMVILSLSTLLDYLRVS